MRKAPEKKHVHNVNGLLTRETLNIESKDCTYAIMFLTVPWHVEEEWITTFGSSITTLGEHLSNNPTITQRIDCTQRFDKVYNTQLIMI